MNKEYLKLIKVDFMYGVEEPWCNNQGVVILPYVIKDNEYHYLLTKEYNPLFKNKQISKYSTITGGIESHNHYQTVIKEMLEETGIDIRNKKVKIHYLGKHYANRSSTKLWYFYGIDLTQQELINNDIQVVQQIKNYKNISEYKKDIVLMEDTSKYNNCQFLPIKDFLKHQQNSKLKPTKKEIGIWIISWLIIPLGVVAINLIHPPLLIMSLVIAGIAIVLRGGAEVFSPKSKKVWPWISNKICKNEELKEKNKKERQSIIKNLTSDKLETKLQTQYDILKQKIDNRKEEIPNQLINNNSNSILKNSNIERSQADKDKQAKDAERINKAWGEKNERERRERVANALGFEKDKSKVNSEASTSKSQSSSNKSQKM